MIYVVVEELVPEMAAEEENVHSNLGVETLILGNRRQGAIQAIAASRPAL